MRQKKDMRVYMADILEAIEKIELYALKGKQQFFTDGMMQDAVIRQLSIVGEASVKLPKAVRDTYEEIPWKDVIAMRNIIVHDYSEIDLPTIWDTVEKGLPVLKVTVEAMLEDAEKNLP